MIKHRAWDHSEKKMYDHVNVLVDKNGLLEAIIFDYEHGGYDFTEIDLHTYESIWHYPEDEFPYEVLKGFDITLKSGEAVTVFEGDIIEAFHGISYNGGYFLSGKFLGRVDFGEYEQNYTGEKLIGLYGSFRAYEDFEDLEILEGEGYQRFDYDDRRKQESLSDFHEIKVIGNIFENIELLEVK